MQIEQRVWTPQDGWSLQPRLADANLVLVFGAKQALANRGPLAEMKRAYPKAHVAGVSTAGEIAGTHVQDGTIVATAVRFEKGHIEEGAIDLRPGEDSEAAGRAWPRRCPRTASCTSSCSPTATTSTAATSCAA